MTTKYKNIMIKLSGEALMGGQDSSVNVDTVNYIINEIKLIADLGINIAIVIGGGNFFRGVSGAETLGLTRANADYMGMLATVMNGILLKDSMSNKGMATQIYSSLPINSIVETYNRDNMLASMKNGEIVIFVGGTGNPFFTTDSGAALRALEMKADILIKATKVDGVYDKDPLSHPNATKYSELSFTDAISKQLKVMDMTAFALCQENNLTVNVCSIFKPNSLLNIVLGKPEGTFIRA